MVASQSPSSTAPSPIMPAYATEPLRLIHRSVVGLGPPLLWISAGRLRGAAGKVGSTYIRYIRQWNGDGGTVGRWGGGMVGRWDGGGVTVALDISNVPVLKPVRPAWPVSWTTPTECMSDTPMTGVERAVRQRGAKIDVSRRSDKVNNGARPHLGASCFAFERAQNANQGDRGALRSPKGSFSPKPLCSVCFRQWMYCTFRRGSHVLANRSSFEAQNGKSSLRKRLDQTSAWQVSGTSPGKLG